MTLHEPATFTTDCLLAAIAAGLAWRLKCSMARPSMAGRWWGRSLGMTAISAMVGGLYHGFSADAPVSVADVWWRITLGCIGVLSFAMDISLIYECAAPGRVTFFRRLAGLKLCAFIVAILLYPNFGAAITDYGITMIAWATFSFALRRPWSAPMLGAIGLSLVAAVVQQLRWSPSLHFNNNDVYHVIQAVALIGFYRAGRYLGIGTPETVVTA